MRRNDFDGYRDESDRELQTATLLIVVSWLGVIVIVGLIWRAL